MSRPRTRGAPRRPDQRNPAYVARAEHRRLWALVETGVMEALGAHPEYLTDAGLNAAAMSITKRVVGRLVGHAHDVRAQAQDARLGGPRADVHGIMRGPSASDRPGARLSGGQASSAGGSESSPTRPTTEAAS